MKQDDKEFLLKDLSARLPYGLKGKCEIDASYDTSFDTIFQLHKFDAILKGIKEGLLFVTPLIDDKDEQEFANEEVADGIDILDFKPYLRPMSSMSEEEKRTLQSFFPGSFGNQYLDLDKETIELYECNSTMEIDLYDSVQIVDLCKKNHLDCYGLIKKGLALSTDEFNPYND